MNGESVGTPIRIVYVEAKKLNAAIKEILNRQTQERVNQFRNPLKVAT